MLFVLFGDFSLCMCFCFSFSVPVKEKKLMDVKLGELPKWILTRDFTPKGIAGAFQRGYYRYYNKYINVKKGSVAGISMVLAAYVLFNYCRSYKELSECLLDCFAFSGVSCERVVWVHCQILSLSFY